MYERQIQALVNLYALRGISSELEQNGCEQRIAVGEAHGEWIEIIPRSSLEET